MGGFLRKIFGHLGFFKDDSDLQDSGGGVPSKLSVNPKNNRPYNLPPVVSECIPGAGGIQVFTPFLSLSFIYIYSYIYMFARDCGYLNDLDF